MKRATRNYAAVTTQAIPNRAKGGTVMQKVEIAIDWVALASALGKKAYVNKSKKSTAMHGAIVVRVSDPK